MITGGTERSTDDDAVLYSSQIDKTKKREGRKFVSRYKLRGQMKMVRKEKYCHDVRP